MLTLFVLGIVLKFLLFPKINFDEDQKGANLSFFQRIKRILKKPQLVFGVIILIMYFYIASEVLAENSIDGFVNRLVANNGGDMDFYQKLILITMTAMVVGCVFGMTLIPKIVSLIAFLKLSSFLGVILAVIILFISPCTMIALPGIPELPVVIILVAVMGFINALFWPVIWSIVLQDFKNI